MTEEERVTVLDREGKRLSPCSAEKAHQLLEKGRAQWVTDDPPTIRLDYVVDLPPAPEPEPPVGQGKRILLHICCAPCATYPINRLRQEAYEVAGYWYNPNIHPFSEHERRRASLAAYAGEAELPVIWEVGYEMPAFLCAVAGREEFGVRCAQCYRMRLTRTAQVAAAQGYDAMTTTLLISPYQDQALIRQIGEEVAAEAGVAFHFENFRQGWAERGRLAQAYALYQQRYCGCVYSEWEAQDKNASTGRGAQANEEAE